MEQVTGNREKREKRREKKEELGGRMLIRNKRGEFKIDNSSVLLEYLGVKKEAAGVHKVAGDVELIASVPFSINSEQLSMNNEKEQEGFAWTLSTFDLDRFGERIDPQGWDFKRYMNNPIVEWAHRYDIPAIGKIEGLAVDDKGLHGLVFFNDKSFDYFGWSIGQRVKAGVIRAGSVGFRVIEVEIPDKTTSEDGTDLIFRKQELLEFSICNVPANPFALAKDFSEEGVRHTSASRLRQLSDGARHPGNTQELDCSTFWGGVIQVTGKREQ